MSTDHIVLNANANKKNIIMNVSLTLSLKVFVIVYGIIRIFLMTRYLGIENYGILNMVISVVPISIIFINASNDKAMFKIYKPILNNEFFSINKVLNEQILEIRKTGFFSLFLILCFSVISILFLKTSVYSWWFIFLLVFSSCFEYFGIVLVPPYVQWYLNGIYKNYIYDLFNIIFSTFSNVISFVIIVAFGSGLINFGVSKSIGSSYVLLIVSFLLALRILLTNILLSFFRKRWMPWFKKEYVQSYKIFKNKELIAYVLNYLLIFLSTSLIPLSLYITSSFIKISISLAGVYYSYSTFFSSFGIISSIIISLRPFLVRKMSNNILELNKIIWSITYVFALTLATIFIIILPYFSILTNSYFSYIIVIIMSTTYVISTLKSVDENLIFLNGRPHKYFYLNLVEISSGIVFGLISLIIVIFVPKFNDNSINILICLLLTDLVMKLSKYFSNIVFVNRIWKKENKIKLKDRIEQYVILICLVIFFFVIYYNTKLINYEYEYAQSLPSIFNNTTNIEHYVNDELLSVNWLPIIASTIFAAIIVFALTFYLFYIKNMNILKKNNEKIIKKDVF